VGKVHAIHDNDIPLPASFCTRSQTLPNAKPLAM
jgi:hypothetical protein